MQIKDQVSRRRLLVGMTVSVILLYLSIRNVDFNIFIESFHRIRPGFIIAAFTFTSLSLLSKGYRWKVILGTDTFTGLELFRYNAMGWVSNFFLPARAGEVVKAVAAGVAKDTSKTYMLGSVAVTRLIDVFVLMVILMASIGLSGIPFPRPVFFLGVSVFLLGLSVVLVAWRYPGTAMKAVSFLPPRIENLLAPRASHALEGLTTISSLRQIVFAVILSAAIWTFTMSAIYSYLLAFGLHLPLVSAGLLASFKGIGRLLPAGPGHIGNFQYFTILALTPLGVTKEAALAFSVFFHAAKYVFALLLGGCLALSSVNVLFPRVPSISRGGTEKG